MVKLFKTNEMARETHKKPRFDLGGGARFSKKLAQNLFATTVCIAMVLLGLPRNGIAAGMHGVDIRGATVTYVDPHKAFCGETIDLTETFTLSVGGTRLVKGQDYKVTVMTVVGSSEDCSYCAKDARHAIVTVQGTGVYDGTMEVCTAYDMPILSVSLSGELTGRRDTSITGESLVRGKPFLLLLSGRGIEAEVTCTLGNQTVRSGWDGYTPPKCLLCPDEGPCVLSLSHNYYSWTAKADFTHLVSRFCEHQQQWHYDSDGTAYQEQTVQIGGTAQLIRVYDVNEVLDGDTTFTAEAVTTHETLDDGYEVEHLKAYNLSLVDADEKPLTVTLSAPVELWFEVPEGWDVHDLEVVLAQMFEDTQFEERIEEKDGKTWCVISTNHFSPYALIDKLSEEEKAAKNPTPPPTEGENSPGDGTNVKTGDTVTTATVAGLGMVLVLALGVMLKLNKKNQFES